MSSFLLLTCCFAVLTAIPEHYVPLLMLTSFKVRPFSRTGDLWYKALEVLIFPSLQATPEYLPAVPTVLRLL